MNDPCSCTSFPIYKPPASLHVFFSYFLFPYLINNSSFLLKILFIFTAERKNKLAITSDPAQMADEETSDAAGNKG